MAEPIPYNIRPIPKVAPGEVATHFEEIRRLQLPGLIIPSVGFNEQAAMRTLKPILTECGVTIHRSIPPIISAAGNADHPLHVDSIPMDDPSIGLVVHHTRAGNADITFTRLANPFCDELKQRNADVSLDNHTNANYDLPGDTDTLLDEGLVNPDVLSTEIYIGSVSAGSVALFAFGGPNPLAHRFISTSPERHAQVYIGSFDRI